jgi:hypothetical protein
MKQLLAVLSLFGAALVLNAIDAPAAAATECSDSADNDGDGLADMEDPDCNNPGDPAERPCSDGSAPCNEYCQQTGAILCHEFEDATELNERIWKNGTFDEECTLAGGPIARHDNSNGKECWGLDDIAANGQHSLRQEITPHAGPNSAPDWVFNFSNARSGSGRIDFGSGDTFFVQWRQRFDGEYLRPRKQKNPQNGVWKLANIGVGDNRDDCRTHWSRSDCTGSCITQELVIQARKDVDPSYGTIMPWFYHSCGSWHSFDIPACDPDDRYSYCRQHFNLRKAGPHCTGSGSGPVSDGCMLFEPEQWMTMEIRVDLGTLSTTCDEPSSSNCYADSRIRLYAGKQDQPKVLIIDSANKYPNGFDIRASDGYNPPGIDEYGKLWLTTYYTDRDSNGGFCADNPGRQCSCGSTAAPCNDGGCGSGITCRAPDYAYTWYDSLRISSEPIADPGTKSNGLAQGVPKAH